MLHLIVGVFSLSTVALSIATNTWIGVATNTWIDCLNIVFGGLNLFIAGVKLGKHFE